MICFLVVLVRHKFCSFCCCRQSFIILSVVTCALFLVYIVENQVPYTLLILFQEVLFNLSAWYMGDGSSAGNFPLLLQHEIFPCSSCMKIHLPKLWDFFLFYFYFFQIQLSISVLYNCSLLLSVRVVEAIALEYIMLSDGFRERQTVGCSLCLFSCAHWPIYLMLLKYCVSTYYILVSCDSALADE